MLFARKKLKIIAAKSMYTLIMSSNGTAYADARNLSSCSLQYEMLKYWNSVVVFGMVF
jgi:hypothetical protein